MTARRIWPTASSTMAVLVSALTLTFQIVAATHPIPRLETRELIVRATADGPAIEAKVKGGAVSLRFIDPALKVPPVSFVYEPTADVIYSQEETPRVAVAVNDTRVELRATAGQSRAVLSSSRAKNSAQLRLSTPDGSAHLTSSPDGRGLRIWSSAHDIGLMSLEGVAKLALRSGDTSLDARVVHDRTAGLYLASGTDGAAASLATTEEDSSLIMTDPGGNTPIELTTGEDGRVRVTPGPKGCIDLDGTRDDC